MTLGNGLSQSYTYDPATQRLSQMQVGTGGSIVTRTYAYDAVGNISSLSDSMAGNESFSYDHRDRLLTWQASGGGLGQRWQGQGPGQLRGRQSSCQVR